MIPDGPEKTALLAVLDESIEELAAQWDGTSDRVGYVYRHRPGLATDVGWLSPSSSADPLLEIANRVPVDDTGAKKTLQAMAASMLDPRRSGLHCIVAALEIGVLDVPLEAEGLAAVNARGQSPAARQVRSAMINRLKPLIESLIAKWDASKQSRGDLVVVIVDMTDPRAAIVARALAESGNWAIPEEMTSGRVPYVVAAPLKRVRALFEVARPATARWLAREVPMSTARLVCLGAGGITTATDAKS